MAGATRSNVIRAQPGPQERFLASPADIAIIGGGNFGGKTFSALIDAMRNVENSKYEAVLFRRTVPQITNPGGLWDEGRSLYAKFGAQSYQTPRLECRFPSGARISFSHMQHEEDRFAWDGSQIPNILFDQLEQFTAKQFWHMLSRNRSASGVRARIRATCNALPDSWLSKLIAWYWDAKTGYPIAARSGVVRWFIRIDEDIHWGDSREELLEQFGNDGREERRPKSFTYISATIFDNPIGMSQDPDALTNLLALGTVEKERRLYSNWLIKEATGGLVRPEHWKYLDECPAPKTVREWFRFWDIAAGDSESADYTAGCLLGIDEHGRRIIPSVRRFQASPFKRNGMLQHVAQLDFDNGFIPTNYFYKGYGSATDLTRSVIDAFGAFSVFAVPERGTKLSRAQPLAASVEAGNVFLVRGEWNSPFVDEWAGFKGEESTATRKDDQVDASSGANNQATRWGQ